jgi:hypothetical protein
VFSRTVPDSIGKYFLKKFRRPFSTLPGDVVWVVGSGSGVSGKPNVEANSARSKALPSTDPRRAPRPSPIRFCIFDFLESHANVFEVMIAVAEGRVSEVGSGSGPLGRTNADGDVGTRNDLPSTDLGRLPRWRSSRSPSQTRRLPPSFDIRTIVRFWLSSEMLPMGSGCRRLTRLRRHAARADLVRFGQGAAKFRHRWCSLQKHFDQC